VTTLSRMRRPTVTTILVLIMAGFAFAAFWTPYGAPGLALTLLALVGYRIYDSRSASRRWLARASEEPLVLHPPFEGQWRVAAGGPNPQHNHHQVVSDQYFAYDFLNCEGDSWDEPILAPCAGMVVHVENRQPDAPPNEARRNRERPFGNYVSIETPRGFVLLAHLKEGSVCVRVGDGVEIGAPVGRCGNSGNTRGAHLHVHAQDRPSQAVAVAEGVPIAFLDRGASAPMLLEFGDRLG
jgi:hypothetical protein